MLAHGNDPNFVAIVKASDNFAAEVAFRVAGGKYAKKRLATTAMGVDMFYDYYENLGVNTKGIKVVDGSGVSRYNLLQTSWMSQTLSYLLKQTEIKNYLAQPGEGTLSKRMRSLKGNVWAKTGTLNALSALCGLVETRTHKNLVFAILISNFSEKTSVIKGFEDDLVYTIWRL